MSISISQCKISIYFVRKNIFFLFYTLIFTKLSCQFIYSIHLFNKIIIFFNIVISQHNPHSHHLQATTIINLASGLPLSNKIDTSIPKKKKKKPENQKNNPKNKSATHQPTPTITIMTASKNRLAIKRNSPPQPVRRSRENQQLWFERVDLIHNRSATGLELAAWVGKSEVIWWNERVDLMAYERVDRWEWGERGNEKKRGESERNLK